MTTYGRGWHSPNRMSPRGQLATKTTIITWTGLPTLELLWPSKHILNKYFTLQPSQLVKLCVQCLSVYRGILTRRYMGIPMLPVCPIIRAVITSVLF